MQRMSSVPIPCVKVNVPTDTTLKFDGKADANVKFDGKV